MKWRYVILCEAEHPTEHQPCEKELDHDGDHYYSEWEYSAIDGEAYPTYPVYWADELESRDH